MTLLEKLQELNAEKRAWVAEDPDNRWTGMYTEDLEHWADMGIVTVEDFERYGLETLIWDVYKDAYGVRPRHMDFKSMTLDQLKAEADFLCKEADRQYEAEKAQEAADVETFKATVQKTIELGAGDEETALRWMTQDMEFYHPQDVEHWVYNYGILFSDYGKELVKKLMNIVTFKEFDDERFVA
jgi:hypothetical protein